MFGTMFAAKMPKKAFVLSNVRNKRLTMLRKFDRIIVKEHQFKTIEDLFLLRSKSAYGRLAEWSMASVLKTEDLQGSGGSNPSPSATSGAQVCAPVCMLAGEGLPK